MTSLEDSLREMFAARVESAPSLDDPAGAAIRRGRAMRSRQSVGSSVAAAIALVLTVGVVAAPGWWQRSGSLGQSGAVVGFDVEPAPTTPAASPTSGVDTGIGLDLLAGDRLWTADGRLLRLAGVGAVTRTYRVPDGWVYGGRTEVRFMRTDGSSISLTGEEDRWVLSPDGTRMAFVIDTVLYVARIGASGLAVRNSVDVPVGTTPVAFLGDRVVLSGDARGFDAVDPDGSRQWPDGPRQWSWNAEVVAVYGGHGGSLAGLVRRSADRRPCLAAIEATGRGLRVERTGGCDLGLRADAPGGRLAPGGAWLAEPRAADLALVDVDRVLRGQDAVVSCPVHSLVTPVWADGDTVVTGDERGVVRCRVDGTRQVVSLPPGVGERWQLVPRLTASAASS